MDKERGEDDLGDLGQFLTEDSFFVGDFLLEELFETPVFFFDTLLRGDVLLRGGTLLLIDFFTRGGLLVLLLLVVQESFPKLVLFFVATESPLFREDVTLGIPSSRLGELIVHRGRLPISNKA